MSDWKLIKAKRVSTCEVCQEVFAIGTDIFWSRSKGTIRCTRDHESGLNLEVKRPPDDGAGIIVNGKPWFPDESQGTESKIDGIAGGSANAEYVRRMAKREERVTSRFPRIGKTLLFLVEEGQSTKAWNQGSAGEIGVGKKLEEMAIRLDYRVLHDRKIPGSSANIDHILVAPHGIFVIDAKNYSGEVRIKSEGGLLTAYRESLWVGGRNQTKLVEGVKKRVQIVADALSKISIEATVVGALAFYKAEFPLFFKPTEINGVLINGKGIERSVTEYQSNIAINVDTVFAHLKKLFPSK